MTDASALPKGVTGITATSEADTTAAVITSADTADATDAPKIFLPEGCTIRVHKPELRIRFEPVCSIPDETLPRKFKLSDNASAIKGWAVERVKKHLSTESRVAVVECDRVVVMRGGARLKDNQMLVDLVFPYDVIAVACPEDAVSFREETPPLELEPDLFSMFELAP